MVKVECVKRNEVESNWTTAQPRSKLQQVPAWEGKQEKSTTAKQNALMEGKQWLLFSREQRKLSSFIIKQEGRELFRRTTSELSWERTKSLVMEHLPAGGAASDIRYIWEREIRFVKEGLLLVLASWARVSSLGEEGSKRFNYRSLL